VRQAWYVIIDVVGVVEIKVEVSTEKLAVSRRAKVQ
jgi:hypothetical protein